jgi:hypothetical protein
MCYTTLMSLDRVKNVNRCTRGSCMHYLYQWVVHWLSEGGSGVKFVLYLLCLLLRRH